jgi:uncharacterized protein (TIGR00251 family)
LKHTARQSPGDFCFHWEDTALVLDCVIQPRAKEDRLVGIVGDSFRIRITAPPVDGKANAHLIRFLSKQFQVKQSAITIVSGETGRRKRLRIINPVHIPDEFKPGQRKLPE